MAITFPRSLPSWLEAVRCDMTLETVTKQTRSWGGAIVSTELAPAYWTFELEAPAITTARKAELKAWWDSLQGGLKTFLAHDFAHAFPLAYASESAVLALTRAVVGGAFDGTFEITTILTGGGGLRSVNAATLRPPADFTLTAGDYISIVQSNRYSLHRLLNTVTSNANGNFSSAVNDDLFIEPPLTSLFTAGATANVVKALGEFLPDRERFSAPFMLTETGATIGGVSKVQA